MIIKLSFLSLFLLSIVANASANPVLQNAGFENWTGGLPDNWTSSQSVIQGNFETYDIVESTESPYEGAKNAKVISSARGTAGAYTHETMTYLYQRVSGADTSKAYSFSFQNRTGILRMPVIPNYNSLHGAILWAGIDPLGGTDPDSPNIIWGPEARLFWNTNMSWEFQTESASPSVQALAENSDMTVFIKSYFYGETRVFYSGPHGTNPVYGAVTSNSYIDAAELTPIPEPSTCLILLSDLGALFVARKRG